MSHYNNEYERSIASEILSREQGNQCEEIDRLNRHNRQLGAIKSKNGHIHISTLHTRKETARDYINRMWSEWGLYNG